ncbi:MAG TPA: hypothetical protein VN643_26340 [Pyrinomonadaceae bacterium]|nr:hypothetical protein [Pyrinomonadaceae bacterium]
MKRHLLAFGLIVTLIAPLSTFAQHLQASTSNQTSTQTASAPNDPIALIREKGLKRSRVMETLSYLSDVIGPRLTGSPNLKRANEWTRDQLTKWGLQNAHLEAWGPFGRGWVLKDFSAAVMAPQAIPLIAYPKAWSPGADISSAEVVYFDAKDEAGLARFKGNLRGKIVLAGLMRDVAAHFEARPRVCQRKNCSALRTPVIRTLPAFPR